MRSGGMRIILHQRFSIPSFWFVLYDSGHLLLRQACTPGFRSISGLLHLSWICIYLLLFRCCSISHVVRFVIRILISAVKLWVCLSLIFHKDQDLHTLGHRSLGIVPGLGRSINPGPIRLDPSISLSSDHSSNDLHSCYERMPAERIAN